MDGILERTSWAVDRIWSVPLRFVRALGEMLLLLGRASLWGVRPPYRFGLLLQAMDFIGVGSISIIALVSLFTGGVFGLQSVEAFRIFNAEAYVGTAVSLTLTREIAPVITALMVAGRAGSAMATEIGSMRITEQIDALATLAVNPIQYLVVPRLLASTIMMPALTLIFNVMGMLGAYIFVVLIKGVDRGIFIYNVRWFTDLEDLSMGLIKATVFGLVVALVGCHQGYHASGGAKGVGLATMRTVVISSVSILVLDFILTDVLITLGL
ncbi:MAG: ABC transporter permease [Deltaproteobacteria bacterium]|nr:ABC transporter permease [Deltaproteobacteria bacterium]